MREGRQEAIWNCVSQLCYISAIYQSSDPRRVKRDDFNDYKQYKKALEKRTATKEELDQIASFFKRQ